MNKREHAVLSLFYDEGHQEMTPSFLAYRMRMRTADASSLLDAMVRESILDLHIEDEGHITYRLPEAERQRLDRLPRRPAARQPHQQQHHQQQPQPQPRPRRATNNPGDTQAPPGTDATPGFAPRNTASEPIAGSRHINDGTDGSLRGVRTNHSSWNPSNAVAQQPTPQPQPQPTQTEQQQEPHLRHPHQYYEEQRLRHQSMVPYQSDHPAAPPAARRHPVRVPVLAGGLSLMLPGLGQFYNGEFGKGVLLLFSTTFLLIFNLFFIVWIWSIIDAYMVAEYRNQQALKDEDPYQNHLLPNPQNSNSNAA